MEMRSGREKESKVVVRETIEQADLRRQKERDRAAWRRQNETPEQTLLRREKERERVAQRRRNEDPAQTALRHQRDRERQARRRRSELPEEYLMRLKRQREWMAERRSTKKTLPDEIIIPSYSENSGLCTNDATQQFLLQFKEDDDKKTMSPFIPNESYQGKCSPIIGETSSSSVSTTYCSPQVIDTSSNMSYPMEDSSPSSRPQFLSVLSKHHCMLVTNLATFWKNGQYCDAAIEAENSKILVHKLLLLAISPKLQCQVQVPLISFLTVKFSQGVDQDGLNAFADYLYNGILSLDSNLLSQLRIIAKQLGIKELELLCENQLGTPDTQPNIEQTDSFVSSSSPDVSISFNGGNINIKKEPESSDYCADSASGPVSINQTFPSENAVNPINHIHPDEEDHLISNHIQHFPEIVNRFVRGICKV